MHRDVSTKFTHPALSSCPMVHPKIICRKTLYNKKIIVVYETWTPYLRGFKESSATIPKAKLNNNAPLFKIYCNLTLQN